VRIRGVIPIENSLAGSFQSTSIFCYARCRCGARSLLRIRHNLIAISGTSIGEIDRVFSHPVALAQCRRFLAIIREWNPTLLRHAGSVKQLWNCATVMPRQSQARLRPILRAQILQADIEDNPRITPLFLIRRTKDAVADRASNKVSVRFQWRTVRLAGIGTRRAFGTGVNLTRSSRARPRPALEYIFYVDCQIHAEEEATRVLDALRPHCSMVKELAATRKRRNRRRNPETCLNPSEVIGPEKRDERSLILSS